ncbi:N-6 DNA methylase [Parasaccharibacter apium]|uniref:N-6 DNA methylase n=1 Tax=Parasaccharibacter apium TaxID=1510841 RepID=UPI0009DA9841|nr:N-6 DNA methylase [Parasaccharibacter apium]
MLLNKKKKSYKRKSVQSIEPKIADIGNGWLKDYNLSYFLEQDSLNEEIDSALLEYKSKNGNEGGNRPDVKLLIKDQSTKYWPILIEYKGHKDKLEKLNKDGEISNRNEIGEFIYKNIKSYAVNGAIHYANALLHYTEYQDVIAIGMTGYKNSLNEISHKISVYYVSKSNFGAGQKIGEFNDFSFLAPQNFDAFVKQIQNLNLSEEDLQRIKEKREREIDATLTSLNNEIFRDEKGLGENDRAYLVCASIISSLGIPNLVKPLEKSDLKSLPEKGSKDGDIINRKISAFLEETRIPREKKEAIVRKFQNILSQERLNKIENGETQIKRVFSRVIDSLGIYYKMELTTDFTGKLFNEMYRWLGFSQDRLNDVVLTPPYVATLLARLSRVNKESFVWDLATGSAGLLVAAMNEMLQDARNTIQSPEELRLKETQIKAQQLLGVEELESVYILAVLNMILMGDGSSNLINEDSLTEFDGKYAFGDTNAKFPANAFVLNPPYSAEGKGMVFVKKALSMMETGYASVLIQSSAGAGAAINLNKEILEKNTLIASIKMPLDLFAGKSSVQTCIYVFKVNESHHSDNLVKFIDLSNDGYTRTSRKKASINLQNTDRAKERYLEVSNLVRFGSHKLEIFTTEEYYEDHINPLDGSDWNFDHHKKIDTKPTLDDFKKTVSEYLIFEVKQVIKGIKCDEHNEKIKQLAHINKNIKWKEFRLGDIFTFESIKQAKSQKAIPTDESPRGVPYIIQSQFNNMFARNVNEEYLIKHKENPVPGNCIVLGVTLPAISYQAVKFGASQVITARAKGNWSLNKLRGLYIATVLSKQMGRFSYGKKPGLQIYKDMTIELPSYNDEIYCGFMDNFIGDIETDLLNNLDSYMRRKHNNYLK